MDVLCALSGAQLPLHFSAHWIAHVAGKRSCNNKITVAALGGESQTALNSQSWFAANTDTGDEKGRIHSFLLSALRLVQSISCPYFKGAEGIVK